MRKMLRAQFCLLAAALLAPAIAAGDEAGTTHAIDVARSKIRFTVQHVLVERVTGTVPVASGTVTLRPGSSIPLAVTAVMDASKLHTDDPDRDASLRSPDFFDTKKFPTWTFTSTSITPQGGG